MAFGPAKITDEQVLELKGQGLSNTAIAQRLGVTKQAIGARLKSLTKRATIMAAPVITDGAIRSIWDIQQVTEANFEGLQRQLTKAVTPSERMAVFAEIRQHVLLAIRVMETVYNAQGTQVFMQEVMAVLDEFEPGTRQRIIARLAQRRAVGAVVLDRQ